MILKNIEYFIKNPKGAIHVGANVGEERDWYKQVGFSRVMWLEPNPEIYKILEANISNYLGHIAGPFGIHDTLEEAVLHISNNDGQSSSLLPLGTHAVHHPDVKYVKDITVKLIRLDTLFETAEESPTSPAKLEYYNFLNIDVQGTELNVLKSMGDTLGAMDYLYLEVNTEHVYKGCALLPEIDRYVEQFGFMRIKTKITKANWGDAFYIKERSL